MENTDIYIRDVKTHVWSGFYNPICLRYKIEEFSQDDACEETLLQTMLDEFEEKRNVEAAWHNQTDCDKLDCVFDDLDPQGIAAIQNAGYTSSDGYEDVCRLRDANSDKTYVGYCYYHAQDTDRAVEGHGLMLAYGGFDQSDTTTQMVADLIVNLIRDNGLEANWDGSIDQRISLPKIEWKRRWKQNRPYWIPWQPGLLH